MGYRCTTAGKITVTSSEFFTSELYRWLNERILYVEEDEVEEYPVELSLDIDLAKIADLGDFFYFSGELHDELANDYFSFPGVSKLELEFWGEDPNDHWKLEYGHGEDVQYYSIWDNYEGRPSLRSETSGLVTNIRGGSIRQYMDVGIPDVQMEMIEYLSVEEIVELFPRETRSPHLIMMVCRLVLKLTEEAWIPEWNHRYSSQEDEPFSYPSGTLEIIQELYSQDEYLSRLDLGSNETDYDLRVYFINELGKLIELRGLPERHKSILVHVVNEMDPEYSLPFDEYTFTYDFHSLLTIPKKYVIETLTCGLAYTYGADEKFIDYLTDDRLSVDEVVQIIEGARTLSFQNRILAVIVPRPERIRSSFVNIRRRPKLADDILVKLLRETRQGHLFTLVFDHAKESPEILRAMLESVVTPEDCTYLYGGWGDHLMPLPSDVFLDIIRLGGDLSMMAVSKYLSWVDFLHNDFYWAVSWLGVDHPDMLVPIFQQIYSDPQHKQKPREIKRLLSHLAVVLGDSDTVVDLCYWVFGKYGGDCLEDITNPFVLQRLISERAKIGEIAQQVLDSSKYKDLVSLKVLPDSAEEIYNLGRRLLFVDYQRGRQYVLKAVKLSKDPLQKFSMLNSLVDRLHGLGNCYYEFLTLFAACRYLEEDSDSAHISHLMSVFSNLGYHHRTFMARNMTISSVYRTKSILYDILGSGKVDKVIELFGLASRLHRSSSMLGMNFGFASELNNFIEMGMDADTLRAPFSTEVWDKKIEEKQASLRDDDLKVLYLLAAGATGEPRYFRMAAEVVEGMGRSSRDLRRVAEFIKSLKPS